jgi:hypothetical protein
MRGSQLSGIALILFVFSFNLSGFPRIYITSAPNEFAQKNKIPRIESFVNVIFS